MICNIVRILIVFFLAFLGIPGLAGNYLTLNQRMAYQKKVEEVYYHHRTGTKPPFEEVMPKEALQAKVGKYLLESAIVAQACDSSDGITEERLQNELERICRSTKAPGILREIFTALDENGFLVKEILIRPILADKTVRVLYQKDKAFQSDKRAEAESILKELTDWNWETIAPAYDAEYGKVKMEAKEDGVGGQRAVPNTEGNSGDMPLQDRAIEVERDILAQRHAELSDGKAKMRETEDAFVIERLLTPPHTTSHSLLTLEVETIRVPKRTYEAWLKEKAAELRFKGGSSWTSAADDASRELLWEPLPPIVATACTPDSWKDRLR